MVFSQLLLFLQFICSKPKKYSEHVCCCEKVLHEKVKWWDPVTESQQIWIPIPASTRGSTQEIVSGVLCLELGIVFHLLPKDLSFSKKHFPLYNFMSLLSYLHLVSVQPSWCQKTSENNGVKEWWRVSIWSETITIKCKKIFAIYSYQAV